MKLNVSIFSLKDFKFLSSVFSSWDIRSMGSSIPIDLAEFELPVPAILDCAWFEFLVHRVKLFHQGIQQMFYTLEAEIDPGCLELWMLETHWENGGYSTGWGEWSCTIHNGGSEMSGIQESLLGAS